MRIYDITQPLRPGTPVWPGDTAFEEVRTWAIGDGPVNVSRLTLSTHTGTHADAPLHYDSSGPPIGGVDVETYIGPCLLLDRRGMGPRLEPHHVPDGPLPARVLFRTFETFPHDVWPRDWTVASAALIAHLADRGVRLIGIDGPSLDPETSKTMDAHMAVRARGMAILEGLVLDAPPDGLYELIALPLRLANADASPVRAILRALA